MKTIMITGPSSNSGKTTLALGITRALKNRGLDISAFKTGPDFIDTKYLELASAKRAGNLDMHMMGREGIFKSIAMNSGEYGLIEGAMGYFDGIYNTYENSSYDISKSLKTPAILVYTPKGEMFSAIPKIKGMVDFPDSMIKGIILNKTSPMIYGLLKDKIEEYIGIKLLGYLPHKAELQLGSSSLGLVQPNERSVYEDFIEASARSVEETIDIDGLIHMMEEVEIESYKYSRKRDIKIAIAYDEAFNFYYNENLKLLENTCELIYFSPLKDREVPACDLIYIGGGYPELYLEKLSNNKSMRDSMLRESKAGKHILAEGGGFMYLTDSIEDYPMVGVFRAKASLTDKLQRFGYVDIELKEDTIIGEKGTIIKGKEYHKSTIDIEEKTLFNIKKPMSKRRWECGYSYKNTLCYYQHINFLGNIYSLEYLLDRVENKKKR